MSGRQRSVRERGAALVTVLMIVAAMSAVALGLSRSMLASTERARLLDAQAQLRLYMVAGEEVVLSRLTQLTTETGGQFTLDFPGFGEPETFPIEGGSVTISLRDMTNCFNLNVESSGTDPNGGDVEDAPTESLVTVLEAQGLARGDATALAGAVGDWIDRDGISRVGGAEDAYYLGLQPPFRTSGQPLHNLEELRVIRGFNAEVFDVAAPVLCALPEQTLNPAPPLNINTLTEADAVRLVGAFSGALEPQEARNLVLSRPLGGWPDVETFLEDPVIKRVAPEQRRLNRLSVVSSLVETTANVSYRGEAMRVRLLFELTPGEPVRVLRRERVG